MNLTGAQILCGLLERQGIEIVSGIPGGAILPLYDALHDTKIRHVLARHEQGAGFIAQGMARVTGRAAVCLATSGPGATNLLTAIADARLDSIPLVAITAQVPQGLIGTDAFQEVDTYGLTLPITKHNFMVRSARELLEVVPRSFSLAESGRPGPVAIDVPKDVLVERISFAAWPEPGRRIAPPLPTTESVARLAAQLRRARRPVLYLGGGVVSAGAGTLVRDLAHRIDAPVVATLLALGAVAQGDALFMGMLGMHGAKGTNLLLEEADLVLALGARFDDRATGKVAEFCPHAEIAHVDIDPAEIGKIKQPFLGIVGDVGDVLRQLLPRLPGQPRAEWRERAKALRAGFGVAHPAPDEAPLHPINLCHALAALLPEDTVITTDVGQHQMWVAQGYPFRRPRTLLTSGGLGTMGFGLPAAIGAALAAPRRRVICVSGDGSILMNLQELATLAELDLPVTVLVWNNGHLGLVRQQQELFYGRRYAASRFDRSPDFAAIARGFGIRAVRLTSAENTADVLREAFDANGPCVIEIPIQEQANVLPMVPPGAANRSMILEPIHAHA